jgi:hypothetical protein
LEKKKKGKRERLLQGKSPMRELSSLSSRVK